MLLVAADADDDADADDADDELDAGDVNGYQHQFCVSNGHTKSPT